MRRIYSWFTCLTLLVSFSLNAQVQIDPVTAEEAVEALLGGGVQAFNITYSGDPVQLGLLTNGEDTDFPIGQGVVLSTAYATNLETCDDAEPIGVSGEPDLLEIANSVPDLIGEDFFVSSANDVCILEFDFVSSGNELSFLFSFGSNEYTEWINSQYNDMFAFFLSGPGIIGPYDSPPEFPEGAINLALVPDSDPELPITISSVNQTLNDEYYINNPLDEGICIDGYTTGIEVNYPLICNEVYHIKMAIADGTGEIEESFVAIESGSFSSSGVFITASNAPDEGIGLDNDTLLVEGCNAGYFTVFRSDVSSEETIEYVISGTADTDDYESLSGSVTFEAGELFVEIPVEIIDDGLVEGSEELTISYTYINACDEEVTASATFLFVDPTPVVLAPEDVLVYCGSVFLTVPVEQGYGPFEWAWGNPGEEEPFETTEGIVVGSLETSTYWVTATDLCGNSDSTTVSVIVSEDEPPPIAIDQTTFEVFCPGDFLVVEPEISGGAPDYFYVWSNGGDESSYADTFDEDTTLELLIGDQCGNIVEFVLEVLVTEYVPISISVDDIELDCPGELGTLVASAINGVGDLVFFWVLQEEGNTLTDNPDETTTYSIEVIDQCGNIESSSAQIIVPDIPALSATILAPICPEESQEFMVEGGLEPVQLIFDENSISIIDGEVVGNFVGNWSILAVDACNQELEIPLLIQSCGLFVPNIITPNDDEFNDFLILEGIETYPEHELRIFSRWGEEVYFSDNYENDWFGENSPDGTYYYVLDLGNDEVISGYFLLLRE